MSSCRTQPYDSLSLVPTYIQEGLQRWLCHSMPGSTYHDPAGRLNWRVH